MSQRRITFKVTVNQNGHAITRRVPLELPCNFDQFIESAATQFDLQVHAVKWTDEDGDEITMTSESEWQDMLDSIDSDASTMRLSIVAAPSQAATSFTATSAAATSSAIPEAQSQAGSAVQEKEDEEYDKLDMESVSDAESQVSEQEVNFATETEAAPLLPLDSEHATDPATAINNEEKSFTEPESINVDTVDQDPPEQPLPGPSSESTQNDSNPPRLHDLLSSLPAQVQGLVAELQGLFLKPSALHEQVPVFARHIQDEVARTVGDVLSSVRVEAERARGDYERFKEELQQEKEKLARDLESKMAEYRNQQQAGQQAQSPAADESVGTEDESVREQRRQEAREARRLAREAKQREAVREGKRAERSAQDELSAGAKKADDTKPFNVEDSATKPTQQPRDPQPSSSSGPFAFRPFSPFAPQPWRIPGSFIHGPANPSAASQSNRSSSPWAEVTPAQLKHALVELGFDAENDLGIRIAAERAWEMNRGKTLQEMVQAAVDLLV